MGEKNPPRSCQSGHITTAAVLKRRGGGGERGWGEKRGPIRKWLEGAKKKMALPASGWVDRGGGGGGGGWIVVRAARRPPCPTSINLAGMGD